MRPVSRLAGRATGHHAQQLPHPPLSRPPHEQAKVPEAMEDISRPVTAIILASMIGASIVTGASGQNRKR